MSFFKRKKYVFLGEHKDDNSERLNKLEGLVAFLCRHNGDETVLKKELIYYPYSRFNSISVVYINNDELKEVKLGTYDADEEATITYDKEHMAIVRIGKKHLMIDKKAGTVADITDLYVGGEEDKTEEEEKTNDTQSKIG